MAPSTSPSPLDGIESQILAGTRLLTAEELAPRLGFAGKHAARTVRQQAARGQLPVIRVNPRTLRFHWPTVMSRLGALVSTSPTKSPE